MLSRSADYREATRSPRFHPPARLVHQAIPRDRLSPSRPLPVAHLLFECGRILPDRPGEGVAALPAATLPDKGHCPASLLRPRGILHAGRPAAILSGVCGPPQTPAAGQGVHPQSHPEGTPDGTSQSQARKSASHSLDTSRARDNDQESRHHHRAGRRLPGRGRAVHVRGGQRPCLAGAAGRSSRGQGAGDSRECSHSVLRRSGKASESARFRRGIAATHSPGRLRHRPQRSAFRRRGSVPAARRHVCRVGPAQRGQLPEPSCPPLEANDGLRQPPAGEAAACRVPMLSRLKGADDLCPIELRGRAAPAALRHRPRANRPDAQWRRYRPAHRHKHHEGLSFAGPRPIGHPGGTGAGAVPVCGQQLPPQGPVPADSGDAGRRQGRARSVRLA